MLLLFSRKFRSGRVRQELQAGLVEVLFVFLSAVVVREDLAEVGVNLGIDVALSLDRLLDLVEDLEAVMVLS